jgi:glutamyl-Q tRNA(Asp) synthetase
MASARSGYIGRFAPSPTGPLHFGSLVAAVASFLDARANGGKWLVRIEDVDETRCKPAFADDILQTLVAFGLKWDGDIIIQSHRKPRYAEAVAALGERELVYACQCSRREISDSRIAGIDGPIYPGTCRHLGLPMSGNALRFIAPQAEVTFIDRLQGRQVQSLPAAIGDFVVKRKDGLTAYQLAVVVDDYDQGVTDVVRGADLLDSTARQIALQRALGYPTPRYLHIPVATNHQGEKLSKQTLAEPIADADSARRMQVLTEVLRFLGQSAPTATGGSGGVEPMLAAAAANWRADQLPISTHRTIDPPAR